MMLRMCCDGFEGAGRRDKSGASYCDNVDIVYHIATPGIAAKAKKAAIYKARRFSDHAPLTIDYDF